MDKDTSLDLLMANLYFCKGARVSHSVDLIWDRDDPSAGQWHLVTHRSEAEQNFAGYAIEGRMLRPEDDKVDMSKIVVDSTHSMNYFSSLGLGLGGIRSSQQLVEILLAKHIETVGQIMVGDGDVHRVNPAAEDWNQCSWRGVLACWRNGNIRDLTFVIENAAGRIVLTQSGLIKPVFRKVILEVQEGEVELPVPELIVDSSKEPPGSLFEVIKGAVDLVLKMTPEAPVVSRGRIRRGSYRK